MADKYFAVPQGKVYIASRDSTGITSGYAYVGDCDGFTITSTQSFLDIYESNTGNRAIVAHIPSQTDLATELSVLNIDATNLAKAYYGDVVTSASGSVTAESHAAYNGSSFALLHPNVTTVVVKKGVASLVLNTDYSLDAATGIINILPGSTSVTAGAASTLLVDYTHVGSSKIRGLTQGIKDYALMFVGKSKFDNETQIATIHRVALDIAASLSLIGTGLNKLVLKGKLLPAYEQPTGESQYFTYIQE
jgi:hypothetical protein